MTAIARARPAVRAARATVHELAAGGPFRRAATVATLAIVFVLPWSDAVPAVDALAAALGIGALGVAAVAVLAEGLRRRLGEAQVLGLLFLALALTSLTWTIDQAETQTFVLPIVQIAALLVVAHEFCPGRPGARALAHAYVLGCGVAVLATLGTWLGGGPVEDNRLQVGDAQPNDLAYALSLGIPLAWYLSRQTSGRVLRIGYQLLVPASLYGIVLVASRSGLIVGVLGLLIVPWTLLEHSPRRLAALLVAGALAIPVALPLLPDEQLDRLTSTGTELTEGTLNGRLDLWSAAWATLTEHPLTGVGAGASRVELRERTGMDFRAHNTPLSIGAELGAVGILVVGLLVLVVVQQARRTAGLDRKLVIVLGLVLAVGLQVRHWEYQPTLWAIVVILVGIADVTVPYAPAVSSRPVRTPMRSR